MISLVLVDSPDDDSSFEAADSGFRTDISPIMMEWGETEGVLGLGISTFLGLALVLGLLNFFDLVELPAIGLLDLEGVERLSIMMDLRKE